VDKCLVGGRQARQQERRFVWSKWMQLQRQVETAVQRGSMLLKSLHVAHRGSAEQQPELGLSAGTVEECPHDSRQVWRTRHQLSY